MTHGEKTKEVGASPTPPARARPSRQPAKPAQSEAEGMPALLKSCSLERIQESDQVVSLLVSEVGESSGRVDGLAVVAKDCIGA